MPAMKGLDPANLRANLRETTQPDPAKKVCTCISVCVCSARACVCACVGVCVLDLFPVCMILCIL